MQYLVNVAQLAFDDLKAVFIHQTREFVMIEPSESDLQRRRIYNLETQLYNTKYSSRTNYPFRRVGYYQLNKAKKESLFLKMLSGVFMALTTAPLLFLIAVMLLGGV